MLSGESETHMEEGAKKKIAENRGRQGQKQLGRGRAWGSPTAWSESAEKHFSQGTAGPSLGV